MIVEKENFLRDDECDRLIEHSIQSLKEATTLGERIDGYRIAESAWLNDDDILVQKVKKAVSDFILLPSMNMEKLHIVKYVVGGEYKEHHDFFHPGEQYYEGCMNAGGQRLKSSLIYLNDDYEGGETKFPSADKIITPKKGKLVVWDNVTPDGKLDFDSIHAGLPVTKGTKYIAIIWTREGNFSQEMIIEPPRY